MAVNRSTLRQVRELARAVGKLADDATRTLTGAWAKAWSGIRPRWVAAATEVAAAEVAGWQIPRLVSVSRASQATSAALGGLVAEVSMAVSEAAAQAVAATAARTPAVIASQLPPHLRDDAAEVYAAKVLPTALDIITARSKERITALSRPLSDEAMQAVARALVAGVAAGKGPNEIARDMIARVEGAFNGGLTRAMVIARTEVLSAHSLAAGYTHEANADVLRGWRWHSTLSAKRTCISCWVMHGTEHPLTAILEEHVQGRCTKVPLLRSWDDLGLPGDEPEDLVEDARAMFEALPEADQLKLAGAGRLALLRSGAVAWPDLAIRRDNPGWRPSWNPTSLRDLQRIAEQRRASR